MNAHINPELLVALRELPPLFPKFLQRRRAGVPIVDAIAARLGIERLLLFRLVQLDTVSRAYAGQGITLGDVKAFDPYIVVDYFSQAVADLKAHNLVQENKETILTLSPEALAAIDEFQTGGVAFVAQRNVLPPGDANLLAHLLRSFAHALAADPHFAPFPGSHFAAYRTYARYGDQSIPMVCIEQSIYELWGARDDAYTSAWREADMEGPPLEALSNVRSGAITTEELAETLKGRQTPPDMESSLEWLVEREYLQRDGNNLNLTPEALMVREDIESETDRVYFAPWPHSIDDARWVRDRLGQLVDKLAAPPQ